MKRALLLVPVAVLLLLGVGSARAQTGGGYDLTWNSIDGGGATFSTGGGYSFVRAQWAARPLVWHIYPQQAAAHLTKLDAFLAIYCAQLPQASSVVLRDFWHAWNAGRIEAMAWGKFVAALPQLREHALRWDAELSLQEDLLGRLVRFSCSRL